MRYTKWIGLAAAALLIVSCFTPWIVINDKITVSGIDATGTSYGKPGYFNLLLVGFFIFFTLISRVWAKRANLVVVALNTAWSIRNYFLLTICQGGDCPEKQTGLYLVVLASLVMLLTALFPDMQLPSRKDDSNGAAS
jgi:hypothetical protein